MLQRYRKRDGEQCDVATGCEALLSLSAHTWTPRPTHCIPIIRITMQKHPLLPPPPLPPAPCPGACVGAGVDLITAADLRYCSADAAFSVKVGGGGGVIGGGG